MPAAVVAAGVTAAGQGLGAIMASRANNHATDAQARATDKAMEYEREKEWRSAQSARSQWDAYMRAQYGDRYQPATPAQTTAPAAAPAATPVVDPTASVTAPTTAAPHPEDLPPVERDTTIPAAGSSGATLRDIAPWSASNYAQYLGRR